MLMQILSVEEYLIESGLNYTIIEVLLRSL